MSKKLKPVTAARINEIVRERRGISADTALRLARYFKTDVQSWLNLQANYDLQSAEDAAGSAGHLFTSTNLLQQSRVIPE